MGRPRNPKLALCLELIKSGEMSAAQAAKLHNMARSSIYRALNQEFCPCCKRALPNKNTVLTENPQ